MSEADELATHRQRKHDDITTKATSNPYPWKLVEADMYRDRDVMTDDPCDDLPLLGLVDPVTNLGNRVWQTGVCQTHGHALTRDQPASAARLWRCCSCDVAMEL